MKIARRGILASLGVLLLPGVSRGHGVDPGRPIARKVGPGELPPGRYPMIKGFPGTRGFGVHWSDEGVNVYLDGVRVTCPVLADTESGHVQKISHFGGEMLDHPDLGPVAGRLAQDLCIVAGKVEIRFDSPQAREKYLRWLVAIEP